LSRRERARRPGPIGSRRRTMRIELAALTCVLLPGLSSAALADAAGSGATVIDSGTISGLGARNIGSAAMSGRISALAGYTDASGKVTLFVGAASGGVWKSTDGGTTLLDPRAPAVLFASLWDFRRKGWTFRSGGDGPTAFSGSGLYRSADGGRSWSEITPQANKGFPAKPYGRIALAVAPSDSTRVYAFVESTDSALLISHDGGSSWERGDKSQWMVWRPFYFANLIVDPQDAN